MITPEALAAARADALQQVVQNGTQDTVVDVQARITLLGGMFEEVVEKSSEGFHHTALTLTLLTARVDAIEQALDRAMALMERVLEAGK